MSSIKILISIGIMGFANAYSQSNLISNGSFENFSGTSINYGLYFANGYVNCWFEVLPSPDIIPNPLNGNYPASPYPTAHTGTYFSHAAGSFIGNGCAASNETIGTSVMIIKNKAYRLTFWFQSAQPVASTGATYHIGLYNNITTSACSITSTNFQVILDEPISIFHPSNFGWYQMEVYFTADNNYSQLVFYPSTTSAPYAMSAWLDDVEMYEACDEFLENDDHNMSGLFYYGDYIEVSLDASGIPSLNPSDEDFTHLIAGNYIEMSPNFESYIPTGGDFFLAEIDPCEFQSQPYCSEPKSVFYSGGGDEISNQTGVAGVTNSMIDITIQSNTISAIVNTHEVYISSYTLYTIDGKMISQQNEYFGTRVDLEIFSAGMYVLNILLSDGSAKNFKIVI